jgi:hypothetical protein
MWMTFDDLASCVKRNLIERIRELAQPSPDGWNHAAFLQHSSPHVPFESAGSSDLCPERENCAGRNHCTI